MSYAGPVARGKRGASPSVTPIGGSGRGVGGRLAAPTVRAQSFLTGAGESRSVVFAAGVAVGAIVGAGVALLLAPRSGAETRFAIGREARRLRRRGRDAWDDFRDELRRARRRARRTLARRHERAHARGRERDDD